MSRNARMSVVFALGCLIAPGCSVLTLGPTADRGAPMFATDRLHSSNGLYEAGLTYLRGDGVPQNRSKAVSYFKAAADRGDSRAMNDLGLMYVKGDGIPVNLLKGLNLIDKAAAAGNAGARYNLGLMSYHGYGTRKNQEHGLSLINTAAHQGYAPAKAFIVGMYARPLNATERSDLMAALSASGLSAPPSAWTEAARESGRPALWAQFFAANSAARAKLLPTIMFAESGCPECLQGDFASVRRKHNEASYFETSASSGKPEALYNAGLARLRGDGVAKDVEEGTRKIIQAADKGYTPAQYALGIMYVEGQGVAADPVSGYAWLNIAASAGPHAVDAQNAREALAKLRVSMRPSEIKRAESMSANWRKGDRWYLPVREK